MMSFSEREILLSVVYSMIYGVIFSSFYSFILVTSSMVKSIPIVLKKILVFDKLLPAPKTRSCITKSSGKITAFLSVIAFALGFSLLSYIALDGQIRIYMLVLSSASLYISNFVFFGIFEAVISSVFDIVIFVISLSVRCLIMAVKKVNFVKK